MANQWWSWTLTGAGLLFMYLISTGRAWPWLLSATGQVGWISYGLVSRQWGFIVLGVSNAAIHFLGFVRTRRRLRLAESAGVAR